MEYENGNRIVGMEYGNVTISGNGMKNWNMTISNTGMEYENGNRIVGMEYGNVTISGNGMKNGNVTISNIGMGNRILGIWLMKYGMKIGNVTTPNNGMEYGNVITGTEDWEYGYIYIYKNG